MMGMKTVAMAASLAGMLALGCGAMLSASAQTPPQSNQSPSQVALQIDGVINAWAQALESQGREIVEARQALAAAQARVKALEDKYEPKPAEPKK